MLCGKDVSKKKKWQNKYKIFFFLVAGKVSICIINHDGMRPSRSSDDRQRRVGLRQIDGIAFGGRRSGTGARGQAALDAVEKKLVAVVQVAKPGGRRGHGVRRFLDFVNGRQHGLLAGIH